MANDHFQPSFKGISKRKGFNGGDRVLRGPVGQGTGSCGLLQDTTEGQVAVGSLGDTLRLRAAPWTCQPLLVFMSLICGKLRHLCYAGSWTQPLALFSVFSPRLVPLPELSKALLLGDNMVGSHSEPGAITMMALAKGQLQSPYLTPLVPTMRRPQPLSFL